MKGLRYANGTYNWVQIKWPYRCSQFELLSTINLSAMGTLLAGGVAGVWEETRVLLASD